MTALLSAVFVASLAGSLHCAGMCGPFVAFCMATPRAESARPWALHLAYNGGRLATYSVLGGAAGLLGSALDLGGAWLGVQRAAMLAAGSAMVGFGAVTLLRIAGLRIPRVPLPAAVARALGRGRRVANGLPPIPRGAAIGALSTLLPCGWLYAFVVVAAGTGSATAGALAMAVFWLGTLPVLVLLGTGVDRLAPALRRRLPAATALALVVVGLVALAGRSRVEGLRIPAGGSVEAATERARGLDAAELPCHPPAP